MVGPDAHSYKADRDRRCHHDWITENRFTGEDRDDLRSECKSGNDKHIYFRMAEDPEEMHPNHRRSSGLRIEKMSTQVAVDEQHQLRSGEWAHGENHKAGHYEIQPGEQRHLPENHSRAAHAEDSGNDVDRRSDASEAGNQ